jgi:protein-arginine kinase activator protein McsA
MAETASDLDREQSVRIVTLFSVLIHAWQRNEFSEAAQARDELTALGVKMTIPPRRIRKGGDDA